MKTHEIVRYVEIALVNEGVAVAGDHAALVLGDGVVAPLVTDDDTLLPIGWFTRDLTGDGVAKARVRLYRDLELVRFGNVGGAISDSDIGAWCYAGAGGVTLTAASNARVGRVWGIAPDGQVMVEVFLFALSEDLVGGGG